MSHHPTLIVGLDIGDKFTHFCVISGEDGEIVEEGRVATTEKAFGLKFEDLKPSRVALETGTHSPWIGRTQFMRMIKKTTHSMLRCLLKLPD